MKAQAVTLAFGLAIFILVLPCVADAQSESRRSYRKDIQKEMPGIKEYYGCTVGPCYSWWAIALAEPNELLMQTGGHHPAGARTRYYPIGTWKVSGDTLTLDIDENVREKYMFSTYRIERLYYCELLLPLPSNRTEDWDGFLAALVADFEKSKEYELNQEYLDSEKAMAMTFAYYAQRYSEEKRFLIEDKKR